MSDPAPIAASRPGIRPFVAACVAFALLFTQAVAGLHRHGLVGAEQRECAACVVAHAPGAIPVPLPFLAEPWPSAEVAPAVSVGHAAVDTFSHASPLACGPPA